MIILSAALDLVGPNVPKGVVLLADVIPSFGTKLIAPYFIHVVPYSVRIVIFVGLSVVGMLLIALTPAYTDGGTITTKLVGIVLASLSSGGGELSFLGLTHFYGHFSLAAWGSGTGAAGLVGAGAYALATTSLGFSVKATILASACLPAIMILSFFTILPREPLHYMPQHSHDYEAVCAGENDVEERDIAEEDPLPRYQEHDGLLSTPDELPKPVVVTGRASPGWIRFQANLRRVKSLFFPL